MEFEKKLDKAIAAAFKIKADHPLDGVSLDVVNDHFTEEKAKSIFVRVISDITPTMSSLGFTNTFPYPGEGFADFEGSTFSLQVSLPDSKDSIELVKADHATETETIIFTTSLSEDASREITRFLGSKL